MADDSKVREKLRKNGRKEALALIKKYGRYFAAGALALVLVFVLVKCAGPTGDAGGENVVDTEQTETEEGDSYRLNAHEEVNALIERYFEAYAVGDVDTIGALAWPLSEREQAYIWIYSLYVEEYRNIACYTRPGAEPGSYMVAVKVDIKFEGVETAAPGLDFFYVRTTEAGTLYIDNLYSNYNLANQENAFDTGVYSLLLKLINGEEHLAMQSEIQTRYEEAVASDPALTEMVGTTIPNAINDWVVQMASMETETTEAGTEPDTQEPAASETPQPETPAEPEQPQQEMVYAVDKVNVRRSASTDAERIGSLEKGTKIARTGTEGEWSIVDYGGQTGYVKSEYLSTEPVAAAEQPAAEEPAAGIAEGTVVTLSGAVNIRTAMSETAKKLGTAYEGEKVTVRMSYAEGWTEVNWNGMTGYVKTSLLQ